jgi:hypothetical protein
MLLASLLARIAQPDASDAEYAQLRGKLLGNLSYHVDPRDALEYERALDQTIDHLRHDQQVMLDAIQKHCLSGPLAGQILPDKSPRT